MKLELIEVIQSPNEYNSQAIWVSEKRKSFIVSDYFKISEIKLAENNAVSVLYETTDNNVAYVIGKQYDERLDKDLYDELCEIGKSGFQFLSKEEYDKVAPLFPRERMGSGSLFNIVNTCEIPDCYLPLQTRLGMPFRLGSKIEALDLSQEEPAVLYQLPFKSKAATAMYGLQNENALIYGTNSGKIFSLQIDSNKAKTKKVDNCKNVCKDIIGIENDSYILACGMGYLKAYKAEGGKYSLVAEKMTSGRSLAYMNGTIILNKGIHGLELLRLNNDTFETLDHLSPSFSIDMMRINHSMSTILVSSQTVGQLGIIKVV